MVPAIEQKKKKTSHKEEVVISRSFCRSLSTLHETEQEEIYKRKIQHEKF